MNYGACASTRPEDDYNYGGAGVVPMPTNKQT